MKPRIDLSDLSPFVFAHTTATCACDPLVIHILPPFSTHVPSFCSRAIVTMPAGFDPKSGSVRPKHPMASPFAIAGSNFCFCSSRSERVDRIHHERTLHRRERANARVAALELLHDQSVRDVVESRAAVLLGQVRAEHAERRHLGNELLRESAVDVALADDRKHLVVDELADAVANSALFFGEHAVDVVEVSW